MHGDQINDNRDNLRIIKADSRFSLSDPESYNTVPEIDFVTERWAESNANYNTLVENEVLNLINKGDSVPIRLLEVLLTFLATDSHAGMVDGGVSFATAYICSAILVGLGDGNLKNAGVLIYAPDALEHYFAGFGTTIHYDQEEMCDLILSSRNNIDHLNYNLTKAMQYAEQVAGTEEFVYFTSTPNSGFKFSCYDDKGGNCIFREKDVKSFVHSTGSYCNPRHLDWHNTVGESFCGMRVMVNYYEGTYTMKYRYYLNDIYEWVNEGDFDIGMILHYFHEMGYAKQFLIDGYFEGTISWQEGSSALDIDVYQQIIDTMHEIQGPYAGLYDEAKEYYNIANRTNTNYRDIK